jgi:mediator of RNA polymerase II transcription subunit 19
MNQPFMKKKHKQKKSKHRSGEVPVFEGGPSESVGTSGDSQSAAHEKKHKKQRKHDEEKERKKKKKEKKKKKQKHSPEPSSAAPVGMSNPLLLGNPL